MKKIIFKAATIGSLAVLYLSVPQIVFSANKTGGTNPLVAAFSHPPAKARPWVYWYFMDGHLTREGMKADLEAMKKAGIGGALYLEVTAMGIPKGPVKFMSPEWQDLVVEAIRDCDKLGLEFSLGAGPGWCGSGGPWITGDQAMQHLVGSSTVVQGGQRVEAVLPQPAPRNPFFGKGTLSGGLLKEWQEYYKDEKVIAYPKPVSAYTLPATDEKALYKRAPYSSSSVKAYLPESDTVVAKDACINSRQVIDLTSKMTPDGKLTWDAPLGEWIVMRWGRTLTGQTTRPAPQPGLGWESGKFEMSSFDQHYEQYLAPLLKKIGGEHKADRGLTTLHFDSWEMSSQNWSATFGTEFKKRRGYDVLPWLPALAGQIVESIAMTERFLWDLRRTAQELVIENHIGRMKSLGAKSGLKLTIEPYDMNPSGDLELGSGSDTPAAEFWSAKYGFNTNYTVFEAVSIAHTTSRKVVQAEAFTSNRDAWRQHPGSMKDQGDWAFCAGVNRFAFHRFAAQPEANQKPPGIPWGPFGVHWDRTQTWWEMSTAYHTYLTRCQALLQYGLPVNDILFLDAEGAPNVFRAPTSFFLPDMPDHKGYRFNGCAPSILIKNAAVKNGRIVFPDGMSYRLLVLPQKETMTPELLRKVQSLAEAGALIYGRLPSRSPSLQGYPQCDEEVVRLSAKLAASKQVIVDDRPLSKTDVKDAKKLPNLYPDYSVLANLLAERGVVPDFESDGDLRYIHRVDGEIDYYFIGNRKETDQSVNVRFRITGKQPELWDPLTGERRALPEFSETKDITTIPMQFAPTQSFFVVFRPKAAGLMAKGGKNFSEYTPILSLDGGWQVAFDPQKGGPVEKVSFEKLDDWSQRPEEGIKYYSGTAVYEKTFDLAKRPASNTRLLLGKVANMAEVILNGKSLGIVWCAPWQVEIPSGALLDKGNKLEIKVANLWTNRLIGDVGKPSAEKIADLGGSSIKFYDEKSKLLPSGLLGPITISVKTDSY
jgi:alpha-L-rhamnosidase